MDDRLVLFLPWLGCSTLHSGPIDRDHVEVVVFHRQDMPEEGPWPGLCRAVSILLGFGQERIAYLPIVGFDSRSNVCISEGLPEYVLTASLAKVSDHLRCSCFPPTSVPRSSTQGVSP